MALPRPPAGFVLEEEQTPAPPAGFEIEGAADGGLSARKQEYADYEGGYGSSLKRGLLRMAQSVPTAAFAAAENPLSMGPAIGASERIADLLGIENTPLDRLKGASVDAVQGLQGEIDEIPLNPTMARMAQAVQGADGVWDATKIIGSEFMASPEKLQFLGETGVEQIPNLAASILFTKGMSGPAALRAGGGFGAGSATATAGTNFSEGLERGMDPDLALQRAGLKTAGQAAVDGATGAILPFKIGGRELVNVPAQTGLQALGGGAGEAAGTALAGEEIDPGEVALEGLMELITGPADVAGATYAGVRNRGKRKGGGESEAADVSAEVEAEASVPQPPEGFVIESEAAPVRAPEAARSTDTKTAEPINSQEIDTDVAAQPVQDSEASINNEQAIAGEQIAKTDEISTENPATKVRTDEIAEGDAVLPSGAIASESAPSEGTLSRSGQAAADTNIPTDRRVDAQRRKRIAEMTPEEMVHELKTSEATGLPNKRAYDESQDQRKPVQSSIDIDGLKWVNDNMGHPAGDALLRAVGDAFIASNASAYHLHGDEFALEANTEAEAEAKLAEVADILKDATLEYTTPDGQVIRKRGIEFSHGLGRTLADAEPKLQESKAERRRVHRDTEGNAAGTPPGVEFIDRKVAAEPAAGRDVEGEAAGEVGAESMQADASVDAEGMQSDASSDAQAEAPTTDSTDQPSTGTKLYGGIPLDAAWESLSDAGRAVFGSKEELSKTADLLGDDLQAVYDAAKDIKGKKFSDIKKAASESITARVKRALLDTTGDRLQNLASRRNSKTLQDLADKVFAVSGDTRGKAGTDFYTEISTLPTQFVNKIDKIRDKAKGLDTKQLGRMLYANREWSNDTRAGKLINEVRAEFRAMLQAQKDAGVDIGDAGVNYAPRSIHRGRALKHAEVFKRKAAEYYRNEEGLSETEADAKAEAWWENEMFGSHSSPYNRHNGSESNATKPRKLKEIEKYLAGDPNDKNAINFYHEDPFAAAAHYAAGAARRIAIAKRFGENFSNLPETVKQIRKEDPNVTKEDIDEMLGLLASATGSIPQTAPQWAINLSNRVRLLGSLSLMEQSATPNISEPLMANVLAVTGDIGHDILLPIKAMLTHTKDLVRGMSGLGKDEQLRQAYALSEDLGLMNASGLSDVTSSRYLDADPVTEFEAKTISAFMRHNLLEPLTRYARATGIRTGQVFMRRLGKEYLETSKPKYAALMRDFGVPAGKEKAFAEYISKKGARIPSYDEALADGEMGHIWMHTVRTFTNRAIQNPSNTTRTAWSNTWWGRMPSHILSFAQAVDTNVRKRPGRLLRSGDITRADKAMMMIGMLPSFATLIAMQGLVYGGRDELGDELKKATGQEPRRYKLTDTATVERAISASGLTGKYDPLIQAFSGTRYNREPYSLLVGSAGQVYGDLIVTASKLSTMNSENTNAAERNFNRQLYRSVIEPAWQIGVSRYVPISPFGTALTVSPRYGEDPFVDAASGPGPRRKPTEVKGLTEIMFEESKPRSGSRSGRSGREGRKGREGR